MFRVISGTLVIKVGFTLEEPVLGPDKRITLQSIISHGDYSLP